jgi:ribosomal protein L11 methyltransferase
MRALPRARIVATDMDPQSVKVAAANMRVNGTGQRIATLCAAGVSHTWLRQSPPFDLVIANILAGPLIRLAPDLRRTVRSAGTLVLSGLLIPQAPEVIAAYLAQGFHLVRHDRITGWSTLTLRRR